MTRKHLLTAVIVFLVIVLLVFACLFLKNHFAPKREYTSDELTQMVREINQIYEENKNNDDHWIHYIKSIYPYEPDGCIYVVMLEEDKEHLKDVKKHLKKYPIKYLFTEKMVVIEQ
ncbi:MAG: hypothetical protein J6Y08_10275 [Clostridiales bacterium]|nr:hypothetical protein [Clostridiales bacterium]